MDRVVARVIARHRSRHRSRAAALVVFTWYRYLVVFLRSLFFLKQKLNRPVIYLAYVSENTAECTQIQQNSQQRHCMQQGPVVTAVTTHSSYSSDHTQQPHTAAATTRSLRAEEYTTAET